jgi:predicted dehydrogenase
VAVGLERKLRALGPEGEMRVDFMARSLEFMASDGALDGGQPVENMPGWSLARRTWTEHDSLEAEQNAFIAAILDGVAHEANGRQGRAALDAALRVEAALRG